MPVLAVTVLRSRDLQHAWTVKRTVFHRPASRKLRTRGMPSEPRAVRNAIALPAPAAIYLW